MKHYRFSCVDADGDSINAMKAEAEKISYQTFRKHCSGVDEWATSKGYELRSPGLTLKKDWAVGFYKSNYEGHPVYYIAWSRIEHIWM